MRYRWLAVDRLREYPFLFFFLLTPLMFEHHSEMVSLIPRLSSLAVSGTPAKSQMADLIHVLKYVISILFAFSAMLKHQTPFLSRFLRIDQLVGNLRLWNRLLKPGFADDFAAFLRHYGIR